MWSRSHPLVSSAQLSVSIGARVEEGTVAASRSWSSRYGPRPQPARARERRKPRLGRAPTAPDHGPSSRCAAAGPGCGGTRRGRRRRRSRRTSASAGTPPRAWPASGDSGCRRTTSWPGHCSQLCGLRGLREQGGGWAGDQVAAEARVTHGPIVSCGHARAAVQSDRPPARSRGRSPCCSSAPTAMVSCLSSRRPCRAPRLGVGTETSIVLNVAEPGLNCARLGDGLSVWRCWVTTWPIDEPSSPRPPLSRVRMRCRQTRDVARLFALCLGFSDLVDTRSVVATPAIIADLQAT